MKVWMNTEEFSYEIEALVKAFLPEEKIEFVKDVPEEDEHADDAKEAGTSETRVIEIRQDKEQLSITIKDNEKSYRKEDCYENMDRRTRKDQLKRLLYKTLSEYMGHGLPWGTLTGVRPTKLSMELLEQGKTMEETCESMKKLYYCSEEKSALAAKIADRELTLLHEMDYKNGYSLYIGIPFCPTTCLYCSFTSFPIQKNAALVEPYLQALYRELEAVKNLMGDRKLTTVYIGGGTPTAISAEQLGDLIEHIKAYYPVEESCEFTVEAGRPDSVTREKLQVLKEQGVTRISINPQTMNQKTLDLIGRRHTVEEVKDAFFLARDCGHDNINMDLIVGLPGESTEDVERTLEALKNLDPDSITIHSLVTKRAANLNIYKEQYGDLVYGDVDEMLRAGEAYARANRYEPYYLYRQKSASLSGTAQRENIGYARPGKEGLYNILIMEEKQTIIACGAGSSTKRLFADGRIDRCENVKNVAIYIEKIEEMIERKKILFAKP